MHHTNLDDVLRPYTRLIEIDIRGEKRLIPENNSLLRCFQYLSMHTISYGDFCWNGECLNCQVWFEKDGKEKSAMACRTDALEGMKINRMAEEIELDLERQESGPS